MEGKNIAAEGDVRLRGQLCPAMFTIYFERFHDEATPGDHGGPYGDVHHIGPGAAEHNDYHPENLA